MIKNSEFRLSIYETFAKEAQKINLGWVVLHGSEGYPETIGRDLDVLCKNEDERHKALKLFKQIASQNSLTKWVVFPNPIWGKRVLAISENFEVAELHILSKLNTGFISYDIKFPLTNTEDLFPQDIKATLFKTIVMPILGNSTKVAGSVSEKQIKSLPNSVQKGYIKISSGKKVTFLNKIMIYCSYYSGLANSLRNIRHALEIKRKIYCSPTTPILYIVDNIDEVLNVLQSYLNEIFLDFVCGDKLSKKQISYNQGRQRLIYLTTVRSGVDHNHEIGSASSANLSLLVDVFKEYNKQFEI